MSRTMQGLMVLAALVALAAAGCQDGSQKGRVVESPTVAKAPAPQPAPAQPAAPRSSSGATVSWSAPSQVLAGEEFSYTLTVTNVTGQMLQDVEVVSQLPEGFKLTGTSPSASPSGGGLVWRLARLEPGQSQTMTVTGSATRTGVLNPCAYATCRLPQGCVQIKAVQPQLQLAKTGPAEVLICEPIPYTVTVQNTGDGPATNVVVTDQLPAGLVAQDGQRTLTFSAGTLGAGQSKQTSYTVKAEKAGTFTNRAVATGERGLRAEATSQVVVRQPMLALDKSAPARMYLDREVKYTITVKNTGDGEARNTVLTDMLPAGLTLVSASEGGQASGGRVTWNLGTLAANASKTVTIKTQASKMGTMKNTVRATATCTEASAEATTEVVGIAAILLEVVDVMDPVAVGNNETYEITVTNQGSTDDKNIQIVCIVPGEMEYVSSQGPTTATVDGQTVKFAPIGSLAPKDRAVYKVTTKGVKAGDVRFKVEMTSDMLRTPVNETESTNVYQ